MVMTSIRENRLTPFSLPAVIWMTFVMSKVHDNQGVRPCFVEEMIGKSAQIGATKAAIYKMETKGILACLSDYELEFLAEFVLQMIGNFVVISEGFRYIPVNQRVKFYFYEERSRSTEAQNSSAEID
jgi:hypothetical protein